MESEWELDRARTNVSDRFHCVYKCKRVVTPGTSPFGLQIHVWTSLPSSLALKTYEPLFLELLIPLTGVNLAKRLPSSTVFLHSVRLRRCESMEVYELSRQLIRGTYIEIVGSYIVGGPRTAGVVFPFTSFQGVKDLKVLEFAEVN